MEYTELPPHPALATIVRTYWWLRGDASGSGGAADPALPDGSPELIFNQADPWQHVAPDGRVTPQPRAFLVGQITGPMVVRPTGESALTAVRFEGHGAALLSDDVAALTDRWVGLDALPSRLAVLASTLHAAVADPGAQRVALDAALLDLMDAATAKARLDPAVAEAVAAIRASHGAVEVDALARRLGVSVRTLQRRFAPAVGISPKLLARIVRFQRVFAAWRDDPASLSRVALECGYFDQSHLVRDFRDFAGAPPAGFLAQMPQFTAFFTAARGATRSGRGARR